MELNVLRSDDPLLVPTELAAIPSSEKKGDRGKRVIERNRERGAGGERKKDREREREREKRETKKTDGVWLARMYVKKLPVLFHQGLSSIFQRDFDTNALATQRTDSLAKMIYLCEGKREERRFLAKGTQLRGGTITLKENWFPHTKGKL